MGLERLLLKREDLNPCGSHKDRAAAYQVSAIHAENPDLSWIVISSSGNAAISAAAMAAQAGLRLAAFVSPRTSLAKLSLIEAAGGRIIRSTRALSLAKEVAAEARLPNLRPSVDPLAVEGFQSIAWEMIEQAEPTQALFSFVSSGASFVGCGRAFVSAAEAGLNRGWAPSLQAVQGLGASPIAGEYAAARSGAPDVQLAATGRSQVGDLGARKTRRVGEAKRLIRASGGSGWVVEDAAAFRAQALLREQGIASSLEGAASLAAAADAAEQLGLRSASIVITGADREQPSNLPEADASQGSIEDVHGEDVLTVDAALSLMGLA